MAARKKSTKFSESRPMVKNSNKPKILDVLPAELLTMIGQKIDPEVWLSLNLSCKAWRERLTPGGKLQAVMTARSREMWAGYGPLSLSRVQTYDTARQDAKRSVLHVLTTFELHHPRHCLANLLRGKCHHILPRTDFEDLQSSRFRKTTMTSPVTGVTQSVIDRTCIPCGIDDKKYNYSRRDHILIDQTRCFVCHECHAAYALYPMFDWSVPGASFSEGTGGGGWVWCNQDKHGDSHQGCYGWKKLCLQCDQNLFDEHTATVERQLRDRKE